MKGPSYKLFHEKNWWRLNTVTITRGDALIINGKSWLITGFGLRFNTDCDHCLFLCNGLLQETVYTPSLTSGEGHVKTYYHDQDTIVLERNGNRVLILPLRPVTVVDQVLEHVRTVALLAQPPFALNQAANR